jgi:CRISPR/Cas system CMR-associated protein Cmr5 small subunit
MSNVTADQSSVLDHARAKHAVEVVDRLLQANDEEGLKKYRTVVLNAGTSIRQIGLAQFTAFGLSKGGEHVDVLKDLYDWLRQSSATNWITRERKKEERIAVRRRARIDEVPAPALCGRARRIGSRNAAVPDMAEAANRRSLEGSRTTKTQTT